MVAEEDPSTDTADERDSAENRDPIVEAVLTPIGWVGKQWYLWARDLLIGAIIVLGALALATLILGVWPPMGAVSSGSMAPAIGTGDAVVFSDIDRFQHPEADQYGVVTREAGSEAGVRTFGDYGTVIAFEDPNSGGVAIIHRPMFYVEEGDNWVEEADSEYLLGAQSCSHLDSCPAPHDGYITKGDNNDYYDQAQEGREPIKPEWVTGVVEVKIPYIGWLRVLFA